jgi:hypothetical protein
MKKLLIICLLFAGMAAQAQVGKVLTTVINTTTIADSTKNIGPLNMNYEWNITVKTVSLNAGDATVHLEVANAAAGPWIDYASNMNATLPTTGSVAFSDTQLDWLYMRVVVEKVSATSGTFIVQMLTYKK